MPAPAHPAVDALNVPDAGPLHVLATIKDSGDRFPPEPHICPIRGVTWLCGLGALFSVNDRAIEPALASAAGLPSDGAVDDIVGHWPQDAWLLLSQGDLFPRKHSVYRWHIDRWSVNRQAIASFGQPSLATWGVGAALVAERARVRLDRVEPEVDLLRGLGTRGGSMPRPASMPHCARAPRIGPVMPFANGSLIAAVACPDDMESVVERWASPLASAKAETLPIDTALGAKSLVVEGIDGDAPEDVTVFGNEDYGGSTGSDENPDRAYIAHFDGRGWSKETAPPGARTVDAYIRNAGGSSWAIANSYDRPQLWTKALTGPWTAIDLPALADVPVACEPSTLSKAEDGSVWVWCRVRPSRQGHGHGPTAALLSTLTPSRVVELEKLF